MTLAISCLLMYFCSKPKSFKKNIIWLCIAALMIPASCKKKSADILLTYLHLGQWATSNGVSYPDWYENLAGYRNTGNIYQH